MSNKNVGGTRLVERVSKGEYAKNAQDFRNTLSNSDYVAEYSYLSKTGAYVLFHKDHKLDRDEIEAAKKMADRGIIVRMTSEKDKNAATAIYTKKGKLVYKFSDGMLSYHDLSYEQTTRTKSLKKTNTIDERRKAKATIVKDALQHGRDKLSKVAVLYDKGRVLKRKDIERGIKMYESFPNNTHRFDAIIIIERNGRIHEWHHTLTKKKRR